MMRIRVNNSNLAPLLLGKTNWRMETARSLRVRALKRCTQTMFATLRHNACNPHFVNSVQGIFIGIFHPYLPGNCDIAPTICFILNDRLKSLPSSDLRGLFPEHRHVVPTSVAAYDSLGTFWSSSWPIAVVAATTT